MPEQTAECERCVAAALDKEGTSDRTEATVTAEEATTSDDFINRVKRAPAPQISHQEPTVHNTSGPSSGLCARGCKLGHPMSFVCLI